MNAVEGASRKLHHVLAIQSELALEQFYERMTHFTVAVNAYEKLEFDAVGFFPLARREPDYLPLVEMDCVFLRSPDKPDRA